MISLAAQDLVPQLRKPYFSDRKGVVCDQLALMHLRLNPYSKVALKTLDPHRMPGIEHYQQFCSHARTCNFISRSGRENFNSRLDLTDVHKLVELLLVCVKEDHSYPNFLKVHSRLLLCWFCKNHEEDLALHRSFVNQLLTDTKKYGDDYRISHHLSSALAVLDLPVPIHRYSYQDTDFWRFRPNLRQVNPHIVIFGPGDIFLRQVLPQLFTLTRLQNIFRQSYLGRDTRITLVGEKEESDLTPLGCKSKSDGNMNIKRYILESCKNKRISLPSGFEDIFDLINYVPFARSGKSDFLTETIEKDRNAEDPSLFFLCVPPQAFRSVWKTLSPQLRQQDLVYFEKPFGINMADYEDLQRVIKASPMSSCVYAIDHYQGKEAYALMPLIRRQFLDSYLNSHYVDEIQIICSESDNVKGRDFYNKVGAVNDMLQSHMLGLLALVAADLPEIEDSNASQFAEKNLQFFRNTPSFLSEDLIFGQYDSYTNEIKQDSFTPTYFAASLTLTEPRWEGVNVKFMHGKELEKKFTQIVINFRQDCSDPDCPQKVILAIYPNPRLLVWYHDSKEPEVIKLEEPHVFDSDPKLKPGPYSRLFLHTFHGNCIANRPDNIQELWRILEKVSGLDTKPAIYQRGSKGPSNAPDLEDQVSIDFDTIDSFEALWDY